MSGMEETYEGLASSSEVDAEVVRAVAKGEGKEPTLEPLGPRLQRLADRPLSMNLPGDPEMSETDIIVGDGSQTMIMTEFGVETHSPDANDPGIKIHSRDGSEIRTGNQPLQRDTTADKDIFADGKTRNRKEAFGPNHIVDPYKPMLNTAPMWVRGLVRGIVIALRALDESMGED